MEKLLYGIFFMILIFISFTFYVTGCYLRKEYKKAVVIYRKKKKIQSKYYNSKKQKVIKSRIETDIRRTIDNKQIGYARFTFEGENVKDKKLTKERMKIVGVLDGNLIANNLVSSNDRCLFIKVGNKFLICDLFRTNKILLNGIPIDNTCEIRYGDYVEIGEITFQFNNIQFVA